MQIKGGRLLIYKNLQLEKKGEKTMKIKKSKKRQILTCTAILLLSIVVVLLSIFGSNSMNASAATSLQGPSDPYYHHIETGNPTKREMVALYTYVQEYGIENEVPLKALHQGIEVQAKTSFSITQEECNKSSYSASETVTLSLEAKYGTNASFAIDGIGAGAYSEFSASFSGSFTVSLTKEVEERQIETRNYDITDPADYGFYTVTLKTYSARKFRILVNWYKYESNLVDNKWENWKEIDNGVISTYYYIPTESTYISFDKYDTPTDYKKYMKKYSALL